jgi:serine/threonine protein phosphatase PrpC
MAQVNSAIYQAAQSQPQYAGMGTTLVVAVFHDNKVTVGHIGDSRLYRMRGEDFQADHPRPFPAAGTDRQRPDHPGAGAPFAEQESGDARRRRRPGGAVPEIHDHEVLPGDVYLFCSDGLNDMVDDDEIA